MPFWNRADDLPKLKRSISLRLSISRFSKSSRSNSQTSVSKTLKRQGSKILDALLVSPESKPVSAKVRKLDLEHYGSGSAISAPLTTNTSTDLVGNAPFVETPSIKPPSLLAVEFPAGFVTNAEHYRHQVLQDPDEGSDITRNGTSSTQPTSSSSGKALTFASKQAINETPASSVTSTYSRKKQSSEDGMAPTVVHRPLLIARPIVLPHDGAPIYLMEQVCQDNPPPVHNLSVQAVTERQYLDKSLEPKPQDPVIDGMHPTSCIVLFNLSTFV